MTALSYAKYVKTVYEFNGTLYRIKLTIPNNKRHIIFKDYYHFFPNENDIIEDMFKNLYSIGYALYAKYNINIHTNYILSVSGIAFNLFKSRYDNEYKLLDKLNHSEDTYIRQSYYGGRTEIYKPYVKENYHYDINSLYPYIMSKEELPIGKPTYVDNINEGFKLNEFYGFIDAELSLEDDTILPVLPIRSKSKYEQLGVIYPKGYLRGVYFSEEIKLALQRGYTLHKIHSAYSFKKANLFCEFIYDVYNDRLNESNDTNKRFYKMIMNSLYGRYGTVIKQVMNVEGKRINEKEADEYSTVEFKLLSVAISSAISSYARIYMYTKMMPFIDNVAYFDTDGVFVTTKLDESYNFTELDEIRLVSSNKDTIFIATKFYCYRLVKGGIIYRLRGIEKDRYITSYKLLAGSISEIYKHSTHNYYHIYHLPIIDKDTDQPFMKVFKFYHKRKYSNINNHITSTA